MMFQFSKNLVRVKKSINNWLKIYNYHKKKQLCETEEKLMDLYYIFR
jgi:hypothetical protein